MATVVRVSFSLDLLCIWTGFCCHGSVRGHGGLGGAMEAEPECSGEEGGGRRSRWIFNSETMSTLNPTFKQYKLRANLRNSLVHASSWSAFIKCFYMCRTNTFWTKSVWVNTNPSCFSRVKFTLTHQTAAKNKGCTKHKDRNKSNCALLWLEMTCTLHITLHMYSCACKLDFYKPLLNGEEMLACGLLEGDRHKVYLRLWVSVLWS